METKVVHDWRSVEVRESSGAVSAPMSRRDIAPCALGGGTPPLLRRLTLVFQIVGVFAAQAQAPLGADVEIFGDPPVVERAPDVVRPAANLLLNIFGARKKAMAALEPKAPKVTGMEHVLLFHDGRQMRGKLVEITKESIAWSRVDVNEPLKFGRKDVRRISLRGRLPSEEAQFEIFAQPPKANAEAEATSQATVRLAGSDWLHGEVASTDGKTFTIQVSQSASFSVPREKIAWMNFGKTAVAGFGLDLSNVESWTVAGGGVEDAKNGRLLFKENYYVAKTMTPPKRFEVSFELPVGKREGLTPFIWLQPYTPRPNNYSNGTLALGLGEKEIRRKYIENGNIKDDKSKVPADAPAAVDGWYRYRVLYDGVDRKVVLVRGGAKIGEWALGDEKQDRVALRGMCFNGEDREDFLLGNVRFQPWDGDLSALGKALNGDRLSLPGSPSQDGAVTAISGKTIQFSGTDKELKAGAFLTLAEPGVGLADADSLLMFGKHGELSAADLELRDGKVKFRTCFAPQLEFDAGLLDMIAFPRRGVEQTVADILVFKNGDELPGKLVATANGAPLSWKTPSGFDVEITAERVAGVRFGVKPMEPAKPPGPRVVRSKPKTDAPKPQPDLPELATLELRNGDRLPGELVSFEKDVVRFKHAGLGEREILRSALWSYFSSPVTDGAGKWLDSDPDSDGRRQTTPDRWITLDGAYFSRSNSAMRTYDDYSYLTRTGMKLPPRFEIRCEAAAFGGNEPYFTLSLVSKTGNNQLNMSFSSGQLNINGYSQKGNGRSFSAEVPLRDKVKDTSQRRVRVFVDSEKGSLAVMLNGVLVKKFGARKEEAMTGLGDTISFSSYGGYSPTKLSNFWIGPWSGEVPDTSKESTGSVVLSNGDVAVGEVRALHDAKIGVTTDVGDFEVPMERVIGVEFGGAPAPGKAAGRIRLRDGSVLHVDEFRWEMDALSAKSAVLGEVKFAAADVAELILSPVPMRFPGGPALKKVEDKPAVPEAAEAAKVDLKIEVVPVPQ